MSTFKPRSATRDDRIFERQVGLDLVLLDTEAKEIHILNPSAAVIWRSLTADRPIHEIADGIALSYDMYDEVKKVISDVSYFVDYLEDLKLVQYTSKIDDQKGEIVVTIPDREINVATARYVRPSLKSLSLEKVAELNANGGPDRGAPFSDTWGPTKPET